MAHCANYFALRSSCVRRFSEIRQQSFKGHPIGGCTTPRDAVTLGATTPVGKEENSMKATVRDTYGPPDLLELRDIDIPEIADDEVLVRVHAAGVGRDVWHVMRGLPYPI